VVEKKNSAGHLMEFGEGASFANILKTCVIFLYFSRLYPEGLLLDHEPMIRFGYQVEKKVYKSLIYLL
jgi:hypothetical protein